MQEPNEDNYNVFQLQPKETISAPSSLSQPHCSVPKSRAAGNDRVSKSSFLAFKHTSTTVNLNLNVEMVWIFKHFTQMHFYLFLISFVYTQQRRLRIAESIKALQELLPNSAEVIYFYMNKRKTQAHVYSFHQEPKSQYITLFPLYSWKDLLVHFPLHFTHICLINQLLLRLSCIKNADNSTEGTMEEVKQQHCTTKRSFVKLRSFGLFFSGKFLHPLICHIFLCSVVKQLHWMILLIM